MCRERRSGLLLLLVLVVAAVGCKLRFSQPCPVLVKETAVWQSRESRYSTAWPVLILTGLGV